MMCEKLKELIRSRCSGITIQAAIGGSDVCPRNAVGDAQGRDREVLRRRRDPEKKLLEKQKAGKKKMRQFGKVEILEIGVHLGVEDGLIRDRSDGPRLVRNECAQRGRNECAREVRNECAPYAA